MEKRALSLRVGGNVALSLAEMAPNGGKNGKNGKNAKKRAVVLGGVFGLQSAYYMLRVNQN